MNIQAGPIKMLAILGTVGLISLAGCGGGSTSEANNPLPAGNALPTGNALPPSPSLNTGPPVLSPSSVALEPGGVQQFTANYGVSGVNLKSVWGLSGTGCTGDSCGTIDASGKYTAPAVASDLPFYVVVTARTDSVPDLSLEAVVTVRAKATSSNAKLSGRYAVLLTRPASVVGSFVADGNGNLSAGEGAVNTTSAEVGTLIDGTYSVGSDNHGTISLNLSTVTSDHFSFTFWFALDSFSPEGVATHGFLINSISPGGVGTGFLIKQDPGVFSTSAINGDYAFGITGSQGIYEDVALGRFTASRGSLTAGHVDLVGFGNTSGLQSDRSFTGTYSDVNASGRGSATLDISGQSGSLNVVFYVVSSSEMLWMDAAGTGAMGTALRQSGGPFAASSLHGTAVFNAAGFTVAGNNVSVGEVQFDGMGNLSGTNDENYFGMWFANEPISGTYTVDSNGLGRGAINEIKGPGLNVFYLVGPDQGFILPGNDSLEFGTFEPQTGGPFSDASFSGNYALGTLPFFMSASFASGLVSADGVGGFRGSLVTDTGTQSVTGTYSVAASGRATLSSPNMPNLAFYFISPSKAVGLQIGSAGGGGNVIER